MNLHKIYLIGLFVIILVTPTLGQETAQLDCQKVAQENEELTSVISEKEQTIASLTTKTAKLESDIQYLKESLALLSSKPSIESDDMTFTITSVIGKRDQGQIVVEGMVENHGIVRKLQNSQMYIVDPKGKQIKHNYRKTNFGGENYIPEFQKDIPIKMVIGFDDVTEETPTLKALVLGFYNLDEVIFKNLDVTWE